MATRPRYNRVEFTADFGSGLVQAAFVAFTPKAISFGVVTNIQIHEGTPEEPSDSRVGEFKRITVHKDGSVKTHLWPEIDSHQLREFDQHKPRLAQWNLLSSWSETLSLGPQQWPARPTQRSTCLNIPVSFKPGADSSVVTFCVTHPKVTASELAVVIPGEGKLWRLTGGWPWVLVQISDVSDSGVCDLNTVGKDYRP